MSVGRNRRKLFHRRVSLYIMVFLILRYLWFLISLNISFERILVSVILIGTTILLILDTYIPRTERIKAEMEREDNENDQI